jgi:hypothetical protein
LHLKTRTVSFSIRGPLLALESIDQEEVEAVVMSPELDNLTRGVLELVPEIRGLPQRVYIIGRRPTVAVEYHPRRGRGRRKPG